MSNRKEGVTKPLVSVIVPTYNARKKVDKLIESIEAQDYEKYEVLFVDDGSEDGTYEYLKERFKSNNKVHIYQKEHAGPGPARRYGFQKCKGKYVVFIDCDDWFYSPCSLLTVNEILVDDTVDACLINRKCHPTGGIRLPFETQPSGDSLKAGVYDIDILLGRQIRGNMSAKLFKREKMNEKMFVGAYNFEDMAASLIYLDSCKKIAYYEKPLQVCNTDTSRGSLTQTEGYEANTTMERALNIIEVGKMIHSEPLRVSLANIALNTYCYLSKKSAIAKENKTVLRQLEDIFCNEDLSSFYYSYSIKRRLLLKVLKVKRMIAR